MDEAPDRVHLRGLRVSCIIGVAPEERLHRQEVTIDVSLEADLSRAGRTDDLADTVDYAAIHAEIVAEAGASSFGLLEKLAGRIAEICLARAGVRSARVSVEKATVLPGLRSAGVEIVRRRAGAG